MESKRYGRRRFLWALSGAVAGSVAAQRVRPPTAWERARAIVRSGRLGTIAFCRTSFPGNSPGAFFAAVSRVEFVTGAAAPVAVSCQGARLGDLPGDLPGAFHATLRYPTFIAGFESVHASEERIVLHGSLATLAIDAGGCSVWG